MVFSCSSPESISNLTKVEVTEESVKPISDKSDPLPTPQPALSPTTAQNTTTLRHRSISTKPEPISNTITALASKPSSISTSTQKGKPLKITPVAPPSEPSTAPSPSRMGTDEHTGARENSQPCTPTTGTPANISSSPTKPKRSVSEKIPAKSEIISRTSSEGAVSSQQTSFVKKSKTVRKLNSAKSLKTPSEGSPVPSSPGVRELERKASESSIMSTNSDSTSSSTDKSEEADTPAQVK